MPRRRLARRPLGVLRREPLPDGRAASPAGDQRGRPRGRPDADRRRHGRLLLDAHARGRGAGAGGRARGARRARRWRRVGRERAGAARFAPAAGAWRELAAGPARSVRGERVRLHQMLREVRAAAARGVASARRARAARHALVISRKAAARRQARPGARPARRPSRRRSAATTRSGCSSAATRGSSRSAATPSPRPSGARGGGRASPLRRRRRPGPDRGGCAR